jgi:hypothetical protein
MTSSGFEPDEHVPSQSEESSDDMPGNSVRTHAELEALLLERIGDPRPDIEATAEFWEAFVRQAEKCQRRGGRQ